MFYSVNPVTSWINLLEQSKKTTVNSVSTKAKVDNYYSGPILDILFRKWFPLSKVLSPRTTTPEEHVSPISQ